MGVLAAPRWATRFALAALLLLSVPGCEDNDPHLAALRSDPLASVQVPGLSSSGGFTKSSGTTFGKPRHAEIHREFSNGSPVTQSVLDRAAAIAKDAGWQVERLSSGHYTGAKTIGETRASLVITVDETGRPTVLIIDLTSID